MCSPMMNEDVTPSPARKADFSAMRVTVRELDFRKSLKLAALRCLFDYRCCLFFHLFFHGWVGVVGWGGGVYRCAVEDV